MTVETYQKELSQIKTILKNNPKGMTVTDIAREIKINRNSVAKYLDVLFISGQADMVTFGPAKVFFPSTRIPISMILNYTHQYIALLNKELQFIQVNDSLLNVLGIQRDDIIGRPVGAFTAKFFQIPEIAQNAQQAFNGKQVTIEKKYTDDNHARYLSIQHIPTIDDSGEPGVTLIIEDVTDQRNAEASMKRCTQEWDLTFNAITDLVFITDHEHTIIRVTKTFADFLRLPLEQCLGKKCYQLLHGSPEAPASCPCTQVQLTKKPMTLEYFESHLQKTLQMEGFPLLDEHGEITGTVHILKEITDNKKKEW
jgi:PAS domain S-box-containing protein